MDSSSLAHCKWECQYHIVFIPKFRRKKLYGMVKDDVRDIIKTLCSYKKVEIIAGAVCADHQYSNGRYHVIFCDAVDLKRVEILYKQKNYKDITKSKRNSKLFYSQHGILRTILLFGRAIRSTVAPS